MATKIFKIGEYAVGGHIRLTTKTNDRIQSVNWQVIDMFTGQELYSGTLQGSDYAGHIREYEFELLMTDYTTSYYAGVMWNWLKSKLD